MKKPKRRKRPEPKQPRWFVVRRGYIQNYVRVEDGQNRVAMPLFSDRATCADFIRQYMDNDERLDGEPAAYRAAEIGTVEGETLAKILATSEADEALWIFEVRPNSFSYRSLPLQDSNT